MVMIQHQGVKARKKTGPQGMNNEGMYSKD